MVILSTQHLKGFSGPQIKKKKNVCVEKYTLWKHSFDRQLHPDKAPFSESLHLFRTSQGRFRQLLHRRQVTGTGHLTASIKIMNTSGLHPPMLTLDHAWSPLLLLWLSPFLCFIPSLTLQFRCPLWMSYFDFPLFITFSSSLSEDRNYDWRPQALYHICLL